MSFKKGLLYIVMIMLTIAMVGCGSGDSDKDTAKVNDRLDGEDKEKIKIAVSIVPQATFVKAVGGDWVDVVTMIPPGNSPSNYQPTPKEMTNLSEAEIYFAIEVPTEKANILEKVEEFNKDIKVVSLADKVAEIYEDRNFTEDEEHSHDHEEDEHHHHDGRDPHIWLSPKG